MALSIFDPTQLKGGNLFKYKRPQLGFGGVTAVGIDIYRTDGINNYAQILFPDGDWREESNTTRRTFVITRNAVLTNSGAQSGLRTGLSEATNTWYALYAVKISDSTSGFVVVGDTTLPLYTNLTTLNTAYGTNSWIYLGLIRNGDNEGSTSDILKFVQSGNITQLYNTTTQFSGTIGQPGRGTKLAVNSGTITLTYTYTAGTGTTDIPDNIGLAWYQTQNSPVTGNIIVRESAGTFNFFLQHAAAGVGERSHIAPASVGVQITNGPGISMAYAISLVGWVDNALGVGSNPLT